MPRPRYLRLLLVAVFVCTSVAGVRLSADGLDPAPAPEAAAGMLVLVNGNLLKGDIQREGDVYRVRQASSELVIRVDQVDFYCHTVDEAYERRCLQRVGTSADSHVELARWCLRHNLLEYASRELLEARTLDPGQRHLPTLERQLQLALRNREAKKRAAEVAQTKSAPSETHTRTVEGVPDWARTLFVRQIQPLLVNSCAASGCHQPNSPEPFPINRLAIDGPGHPATTLANLAATLQQLDTELPEHSRLLFKAKTEHGGKTGVKPYALAPHQYHMLAIWVEQLALGMNSTAPQPVDSAAHLAAAPNAVVPASATQPAASDPFDPSEYNHRALSFGGEAISPPESHPVSE